MRKAKVYNFGKLAGYLIEDNKKFVFYYNENYEGPPISQTMPTSKKKYVYDSFPPFFDGLLPEGSQLEALLKFNKIDRNDFFSQLLTVGKDLVGSVTVEEDK